MTMREKILQGGIALSLRQIVSLPLNIAGMGLASVFLSPADFGVLAVITVLSSTALAVIDLGTTNALIQSSVEPSTSLLRQVQLLKGGAGLFLILLYALLSPWICRYYDLPKWMAFMWPACALLAWLQSQRAYQSIRLQRSLEWQMLARVEMAEMFIANLVLAVSAYYLRSPVVFILSLSVRMGFGIIFMMYLVPRHCAALSTGTGGSIRALLGFGIPFQATTAFSMVQKAINPVIVGGIAGVKAVGLVNWSNYIVSLPMVPLQPFYAFLFSSIAERKRRGIDDREILQSIIRVGVVLTGLSTAMFVTFLPTMVKHVFGGQWQAAVPLASLLLLGNIATFASSILTTHLTAEGHSKVWMYIVLVETLIICLSAGLGTTTFGLMGYAYGMVVAGVIVLGIQCVLLMKITGLKISFSHWVRILLYTLAAVAAGRAIGSFLPLSEWPLLALQFMICIGVISLGLVVIELRQIRLDIRKLLLLLRPPNLTKMKGAVAEGSSIYMRNEL